MRVSIVARAPVSFLVSVRPSSLHVLGRLPLVGLQLNFILGTFSKICGETQNFDNIWHKYRAPKTEVRFTVSGDINLFNPTGYLTHQQV